MAKKITIRNSRTGIVMASSKKRPTVRSVAKSIKKIQSQQELKHEDVIQTAVEAPDTGVITLLNGVASGTSNETRIGDDIHATSIQFRAVYASQTDNIVSNVVRHIIFWDQQPNGVIATMGDLLDISFITRPTEAPYNEDFQKRFKILYDRVHVITPQVPLVVTAGVTTASLRVKKYARMKRKLSRTVKYDGDTSGIADIQTNSLCSLVVSDTAAGTCPEVSAGYRFYYKD